MKLDIIIEARMSSSRLPGKVMLKVLGKPLLEHLINRLNKLKKINRIIIATTKKKSDDEIVNLANKLSINYFRGSENDVLGRVVRAGKKYKVKNVINITSDCPILDTQILNRMINIFEKNKFDCVSNSFVRSYPDGMDATICKFNSLKYSDKFGKKPEYREHTTLFIHQNPKIFKIKNYKAQGNLYWPQLGLTLDEKNDYLLIKKIIIFFFKKKNFNFKLREIIKVLKKNKSWTKINSKVKRKAYDKDKLL